MTHHPHEDGYFGEVDHGKDYEGSLEDCDSVANTNDESRSEE
jgi:hypothetical protein